MRAALLLDAEYQDAEAIYPLYRLQEAGFTVDVVGRQAGEVVRGKHGYSIKTTLAIAKAKAKQYDLIIVPGGNAPDKMRTHAPFVQFVRDAADGGCIVAAICHGPQLLIDADVVAGRRVTSYAGIARDLQNAGAGWRDAAVVQDGPLITSRRPEDLPQFMAAVLAAHDKRLEARRVATAQAGPR